MPYDANYKIGRTPWLVLAALLLLCCARGVWLVHGLTVPIDADTVRDIGFIRCIMDGNAWGDPAIAGAWRWYPPLFHAIAASVAVLTGSDPLPLWNAAEAWLNLAPPAAFFVMNRHFFGSWQAVAATCVMFLFGGTVMSGDETAGYTPWTFTPALAWPLFFLSAAAIHRIAPALRTGGAIAVGCLVGIVFLAPLLFDYRFHIANPVPGAWVHPLFADPARMVLLSLPVLVSVVRPMSIRATFPSGVLPLFGTWIGICLAFLARQAACAETSMEGDACRLLAIAPYHFNVYLQAAEACATGWALSLLAFRIVPRFRTASVAATVTAAGRQLVAPPEIHSNPYVSWASLNTKRLAYLGAATIGEETDPAYFLLPADVPWQGEAIFRTADHVVYRGTGASQPTFGDWSKKPRAATIARLPSGRPMIDRHPALRARPG